jgi:hypothetical protein
VCHFAQAKPHKSAALIIATTVKKRNFHKNALGTSQYKRYIHIQNGSAHNTAQHIKSIGHGRISFFGTASGAFAATILRMWSDPIMIRPHAKYRRKPSSFWRLFGHLVRPQLPGSAQNDQTFYFVPNGLSFVRDADNLHVAGSCGSCHDVAGSCHDPTTCKVSPKTNGWMPTFWPFGKLAGACERPK